MAEIIGGFDSFLQLVCDFEAFKHLFALFILDVLFFHLMKNLFTVETIIFQL